VAEQNGKVMITTGAADDDTYKTGNTSLFQLYTPASLYMSSTVDMLKELDPEAKIALVHESDKFSTSVAEGIKPYLEANNFEIVLEEGYASDTTDFGPIVNKIQAPERPSCSAAATTMTAPPWPARSTIARSA
jgi:branched-chain amino acid transport system substrate-binding protein